MGAQAADSEADSAEADSAEAEAVSAEAEPPAAGDKKRGMLHSMEQIIEQEFLQKIESKINSCEKRSSCELLAILSKRSDDYFFIPILWAAIASMAVPAVLITLFPGMEQEGMKLILSQWLAFVALALIFRLDAVKLKLVPAKIRHRRARNMAHMQFISHGLNDASAPCAVLLFISFEERYVQILTNSKVPIENSRWESIIARLTKDIKAGSVEDGIENAVDAICTLLEELSPERGDKRENRFPNRLVIY